MELCGCYDQPKPTPVTKYQWETIDKICFTQCDIEIADITEVTQGKFCFGLGEEWISLPAGDTLEGHWTGNLFMATNGYQFLLDGKKGYLRAFTVKKFYQQ
jgi:hypothetical protein